MITQHSTIGFIGLGAMGQRMARRLLNSGFRLIAYDHTSRKNGSARCKRSHSGPQSSPARNEIRGGHLVSTK
jgi:3-hydroxyisobutyrate dehydrogenase-like beta-hydroxyacid dehydrogenase